MARDLSADYTWKPLKIGAGGWVVGMDIHPTEAGLMYVRTDVAGAYRWESKTRSWKQLVTAQSMPASFVGYGCYRGVDSLVGAPADPIIAYMSYEGEIFRSDDRGDHWRATNLSPHKVVMEPNGEGRQEGERLGIDPYNSAVVYYGSIKDGLWRTDDAGAHWSQVGEVPKGRPPHGVNGVVFDPNAGTVEREDKPPLSRGIYVTTDGEGIFRTVDAGKTWADIGEGTLLAGAAVREAVVGPDRTFYVACEPSGANEGGVWKYTQVGGWKDISPSAAQQERPYWAIAVDPCDPARLFVLCQGGQGYLSTDQGKTWSPRGFLLRSDDIRWLDEQENYWLSVGECAFDPAGELWFAEGFSVWRAKDLSGPDIEWLAEGIGIEETCGNEVIAPPGGSPVGAVLDVGVFRFEDPDTYTAQRGFPYFMSGWSLDWCAADPSFIAGVFRNHANFPPHLRESGYSTDGGRTWTIFPALKDGSAPSSLDYGVLAVSANDTDNIVWLPADNHLPFVTMDRGATWKQSTVDGVTETGFVSHYSSLKALCADRVLPDTFYLYLYGSGVYRSTDGGEHFSKVGDLVPNRYNSILKVAPGHAGDLWFAEGSQGTPVGGLWRSTDGGQTWKPLSGIEQAFNVGFGKALKEDSYPTLFVAGVANGLTGIWRSTDEGEHWDQIGGYPMLIFDWIDAIDGDKDTFGKVYLAFTSTGLAYGEPVSDAP